MSAPFFRSTVPPAVPLIDVHVHLGPSDDDALYYPHLTGEEYLRRMDAAGIELACAFPPQRRGYLRANAELRAWAERSDGRVRAFARLGGRRLPVTLPELWLVRRSLRFRVLGREPDVDSLDGFAGVKLLPHLDGIPDDEVFEEITRRALPVLVHGGVHVPPRWIEKHLVSRLSSPLIVAHLGAFPCDAVLVRDAVALAARYPHVYLDTSGAWLAGFLRFAVEQVPDKLVFGSDAPLADPGVAWRHVASVVHDDMVLAAIGHATASGLLS